MPKYTIIYKKQSIYWLIYSSKMLFSDIATHYFPMLIVDLDAYRSCQTAKILATAKLSQFMNHDIENSTRWYIL